MFSKCIIFLAILAITAADAPKVDKAELKDDELIQGTWKLQSGTLRGKPAPNEFVDVLKITYKANKMIIEIGEQKSEATFKLDPSKKPKEIDFEFGGMKGTGIYELDGDTLKICHSEDDLPRPKEFKSPENTKINLMVYKREKK